MITMKVLITNTNIWFIFVQHNIYVLFKNKILNVCVCVIFYKPFLVKTEAYMEDVKVNMIMVFRSSNLILNLFTLMVNANIPDIAIEPDKSVKKVSNLLHWSTYFI